MGLACGPCGLATTAQRAAILLIRSITAAVLTLSLSTPSRTFGCAGRRFAVSDAVGDLDTTTEAPYTFQVLRISKSTLKRKLFMLMTRSIGLWDPWTSDVLEHKTFTLFRWLSIHTALPLYSYARCSREAKLLGLKLGGSGYLISHHDLTRRRLRYRRRPDIGCNITTLLPTGIASMTTPPSLPPPRPPGNWIVRFFCKSCRLKGDG
jgi:hypothetical protein